MDHYRWTSTDESSAMIHDKCNQLEYNHVLGVLSLLKNQTANKCQSFYVLLKSEFQTLKSLEGFILNFEILLEEIVHVNSHG